MVEELEVVGSAVNESGFGAAVASFAVGSVIDAAETARIPGPEGHCVDRASRGPASSVVPAG